MGSEEVRRGLRGLRPRAPSDAADASSPYFSKTEVKRRCLSTAAAERRRYDVLGGYPDLVSLRVSGQYEEHPAIPLTQHESSAARLVRRSLSNYRATLSGRYRKRSVLILWKALHASWLLAVSASELVAVLTPTFALDGHEQGLAVRALRGL